MEPPGEGRYEGRQLAGRSLARRAAMEPPGEGRYESCESEGGQGQMAKPQWSRPVKGGTR